MESGYIRALVEEKGGFCIENSDRNLRLLSNEGNGLSRMPLKKTGTTICGLVTADSVVLGADTRATEGPIIADKFCKKLHHLADNIWAAGAGGSADLDHTGWMIQSKLELLRLSTGRPVRVVAAASILSQLLFRYQGHVQCALVLGGVDTTGPHLFDIYPHGSSNRLPFCAMGSGSLNAISVLELGYKDSMTVDEGMSLVWKAISAGIMNDLGSGGKVNLVVIGKDGKGTQFPDFKPSGIEFTTDHVRIPRQVVFKKGTTPVILEKIQQLKKHIVVESSDVEMIAS